MRGDITKFILEFLAETAANSVDIIDTILSSGYGASVGKMHRVSRELRIAEAKRNQKQEEMARERQRYHALLYYLRQQGFIEKTKRKDSELFTITRRGLQCLTRLRNRTAQRMPVPFYAKERNDAFVIIAFDIPEKERGRRSWLREALRNLGMKMVQKSVWMGKVKIPEAFLNDLRSFHLVDYVEVFEITKTGSLEHLL